MGDRRANIWLWTGWVVFVAVFFLPPICPFIESLAAPLGRLTSGKPGGLYPDWRTIGVAWRSVVLATSAGLLALALGTSTGYVTTRVMGRGRLLASVLLLTSFFIPDYSYALSWIEWFAPRQPQADATGGAGLLYSTAGAVFVMVLHLFPWIHCAAAVGFSSIERHHEDAGRFSMSGPRRFLTISLPLVAGVLAIAGVFVFLQGLKNLSIPETLRQRVFATEILLDYQENPDGWQAAWKGLASAAVSVVALAVGLWVATRRPRISIEGLSFPSRSLPAGERSFGRFAAVIWVGIVFLLAVALPMVALVRTSWGWSNYATVLGSAWPEALMGLGASAAVATISVVLGFVLVEFIVRAPRFLGAVTAFSAFLLFAIPTPVLDIGLIQFWNRPLVETPGLIQSLYDFMAGVYGSPLMLVIGQTTALIPVALFGLWLARRRIDRRMIEAAQLAGFGWWRVATRILLPLLWRWLAVIWAIVFVLALNDVEAAVLLAPAGATTLSVRIMTLLHYMPDAQVCALCVVQVALTAGIIGMAAALTCFLASSVGRRFGGRGAHNER